MDRNDTTPADGELEASEHVFRFRCSECGDCCTDWNVPVDKAFAGRLEGLLDRAAPELSLGSYTAEPPEDSVQHGPILQQRDGRCVFLAEDQRCQLHAHLGREAKPAACQSYPFRKVELAERTTISLDLSCTAASELLLRPFPPSTIHQPREVSGSAVQTELFDGEPLPAPLFFHAEATIFDILSSTEVSLEDRLMAASILVDLVTQDWDSDGDPGLEWVEALRNHRPEFLRELVRQGRAERGETSRQYLFLARLFGLVETWLVSAGLDAGGRAWASARAVAEWFDLDAATSGVAARAGRLANKLAGIWEARRPEVDRVLANYVWESWRARHMQGLHGLAGGFRVLVAHYALVRLVTAGFAGAAGELVGTRHALDAVQCVEKTFGHLPLMQRFWRRTATVNLLLGERFAARLLVLPEPRTTMQEAA